MHFMDRNNERWQKPFVQDVLTFHNSLYNTKFKLIGRCEDTYPMLVGGDRWDWVCEDISNKTRGAIEVKRLTDEDKHEEEAILESIKKYLIRTLSASMPCAFLVTISTGDNPIAFSSENKSAEIRQLRDNLTSLIRETAPTLTDAKPVSIAGKLKALMPNVLPHDFDIFLKK